MNNKFNYHVVIFVDIRNFTTWSERQDVTSFLADFVSEFQQNIKNKFLECDEKLLGPPFFKNQGDGALIILPIKGDLSEKILESVIKLIIKTIKDITSEFGKLCKRYSQNQGCDIDLKLGWGVTKGVIHSSNDGDYIGSEINKCARLCDMARPYGIVIDKNDFQKIPKTFPKFFPQSRKLKGISSDVEVWVTEQISTSFITRERIRLSPEVHVAGICYDKENGKVLIAKRSKERRLFPDKFEGCGGQLAPNESFCEGVKRHYQQELGIEVDVIEDIHEFYTINQANEPFIPGIMFLSYYVKGKPESSNHSEIKWISVKDLERMNESEFVPDFQKRFRSLYDKLNTKQGLLLSKK